MSHHRIKVFHRLTFNFELKKGGLVSMEPPHKSQSGPIEHDPECQTLSSDFVFQTTI